MYFQRKNSNLVQANALYSSVGIIPIPIHPIACFQLELQSSINPRILIGHLLTCEMQRTLGAIQQFDRLTGCLTEFQKWLFLFFTTGRSKAFGWCDVMQQIKNTQSQ